MYVLEWFDGNQMHTCCTSDPRTAFYIYLSLKKNKENERILGGQYMFIFYRGHYCSIQNGIQLTKCSENEDPVIWLQEKINE